MRIITRGDLDGLTSSALITSVEQIDAMELVHPKDMQDGRVNVTGSDIIVNLPYHPACGMWFDHHQGIEGGPAPTNYKGRYGVAPSASRLVFEHYSERFPALEKFGELVSETDRIDSAQLTLEDILRPKRYVLLSYTLDPRTGLGGPFRSYFAHLLNWIKVQPINEVLRMPEVKERTDSILANEKKFERELKRHSKLDGNVVITDFRRLAERPVGNRFLVYALYPEANVWANVFRAHDPNLVVISLGHSILNRTCTVDVGQLLAGYGGGGHRGAGTCQVAKTKAARVMKEIIEVLKEG